MSQPRKRFGRSRTAQDETQQFTLTERDRELAALAAETLPRNSAAASFERSASRRAGSSSVSARDAATDDAARAGATDEGAGAATEGAAEDETPAQRRARLKAARAAERREAKAAKAEARERRSSDYQPTPLWFKVVMVGLMVVGLLWIITYYLFQGALPVPGIGVWNLVVGLGFMLAGLVMTTQWR